MTTQNHISRADEVEVAGEAAVGAVRAISILPFVLIGLLICPPLAILVVVVVVPLVVMALVAGLLATVFAAPYLLFEHLRGHRGHGALFAHRLRHAGRAVLDLAPHRIAADVAARH